MALAIERRARGGAANAATAIDARALRPQKHARAERNRSLALHTAPASATKMELAVARCVIIAALDNGLPASFNENGDQQYHRPPLTHRCSCSTFSRPSLCVWPARPAHARTVRVVQSMRVGLR